MTISEGERERQAETETQRHRDRETLTIKAWQMIAKFESLKYRSRSWPTLGRTTSGRTLKTFSTFSEVQYIFHVTYGKNQNLKPHRATAWFSASFAKDKQWIRCMPVDNGGGGKLWPSELKREASAYFVAILSNAIISFPPQRPRQSPSYLREGRRRRLRR